MTNIFESSSNSNIVPEVLNRPLSSPCETDGHSGNKFIGNDASKNNFEKGFSSDQPPEIECKCGAGKCVVLTSRTERNPNRRFYRCPLSQAQRCNYFKWCDELGQASQSPFKTIFKSPTKIDSSINTPLNSDYPICGCKAGACTILTMPDGKHKGRKYYACFIIKGHGACDHFEWVDEQIKISEADNNNNKNLNENDISMSNATTQDPNHKSPHECVKDLFSENDMNTIDFWRDEQNPPEKISTGEMEGIKESSPVKRAHQSNDSNCEISLMKRLNLNDEHNGGGACNLRASSSIGGSNLQNGVKRSGKCFTCQREGHWAVDCVAFNGRV